MGAVACKEDNRKVIIISGFLLPNLSDTYPEVNDPTNLIFYISKKKTLLITKLYLEFLICLVHFLKWALSN